jgi:rhodanese-related sulfurtransferase
MRIAISFIFLLVIIQVTGQKPDGYDEELKNMYENTVELITTEELVSEIQVNPGIFILDTREKNEYKVSHIKNALYVGYNEFNLNTVRDIPSNAEIVVYCSLGIRSERIGEQLKEAGYTNVKNLFGGIFEWVYHEQPIVNKKESLTQKVHTYDENWSKWLLKGERTY